MRLMVRMTLPLSRTGRRGSQNYETFECKVVRVRGPLQRRREGRDAAAWIDADVNLPEKYRAYASARLFAADGTYPVEVPVNWNRKSLAAFLASGDAEWTVEDAA